MEAASLTLLGYADHMSDSNGVPDLDTLFGFREMPVGFADFTLKLRAMLTRKQIRAVAQLHNRMLAVHKQLGELMDRAQSSDTTETVETVTVEAEALEDQLADICVKGLQIICIHPPVEALEQLGISDLAGLFVRAGIEQGKATADSITGETGHPTSASSGS